MCYTPLTLFLFYGNYLWDLNSIMITALTSLINTISLLIIIYQIHTVSKIMLRQLQFIVRNFDMHQIKFECNTILRNISSPVSPEVINVQRYILKGIEM